MTMMEWLAPLLSPIIGVGAGSLFDRFSRKKEKPFRKSDVPASMASLQRQVLDIQEWQDQTEEALSMLELENRRLKRDLQRARLAADLACLICVLIAGWLWLSPFLASWFAAQ